MSGSQSHGSSQGGQKMIGPKMSTAFSVVEGENAVAALLLVSRDAAASV
jgi:hypothetical protein